MYLDPSRPPIHYGRVTVYTDMITGVWRLKPKKGSRKLEHYSWKKDDAKKVWEELVRDVKRFAR